MLLCEIYFIKTHTHLILSLNIHVFIRLFLPEEVHLIQRFLGLFIVEVIDKASLPWRWLLGAALGCSHEGGAAIDPALTPSFRLSG